MQVIEGKKPGRFSERWSWAGVFRVGALRAQLGLLIKCGQNKLIVGVNIIKSTDYSSRRIHQAPGIILHQQTSRIYRYCCCCSLTTYSNHNSLVDRARSVRRTTKDGRCYPPLPRSNACVHPDGRWPMFQTGSA